MLEVRPALVDLALTKCNPGIAAYQATIWDLAARGFLGVSGGPDGPRVRLASRPTDTSGLAGYEQQVLSDVCARLTGADGAPVAALAEACSADVRGIWQPFQEKLLAEGRRLGVSRRKAWAHSVPTVLMLTCVVMALAGFLSRLVWHVSIGVTVVITILAAPAFWWLVDVAGTDTLTSAGDDIAAQWKRARPGRGPAAQFPGAQFPGAQFPGGQFPGSEAPAGLPGGLDPASLERHAFAVAASLEPVLSSAPDAAPSRRVTRAAAGPPVVTRDRPDRIWSSFSGTWRQVRPETSGGLGTGGAEPGMMFSLAGLTLALIVVAVLITMDEAAWATGPVVIAMIAVAAVLIVKGMGTVSRRAALPKSRTFEGQVIAHWQEHTDSESGSGLIQCTAIDDGQRAWIFSQQHLYQHFPVGSLVQVTVSPRTGDLQRVVPRPGAARPDPGQPPAGQL
jgi:hypothetical protein